MGHTGGIAWEFEFVGVAELDGDGRVAATVIVDADELDDAYAELDRRYLEQLDRMEPRAAPTWSTGPGIRSP